MSPWLCLHQTRDPHLCGEDLAQMFVDVKRLTSLGLLLNSYDFEKEKEKKEKFQNVNV